MGLAKHDRFKKKDPGKPFVASLGAWCRDPTCCYRRRFVLLKYSCCTTHASSGSLRWDEIRMYMCIYIYICVCVYLFVYLTFKYVHPHAHEYISQHRSLSCTMLAAFPTSPCAKSSETLVFAFCTCQVGIRSPCEKLVKFRTPGVGIANLPRVKVMVRGGIFRISR